MRKKTRATLDVAAVTAAWDAFFIEQNPPTREELEKQGWKPQTDLYKKGFNWRALSQLVASGKLESKKFRAKLEGRARSYTFYRPKI